MMANRYTDMTDTDFDDLLAELIGTMCADEILAIPGVYEVLQEALNNEVLELWEEKHGYEVDDAND